MLRSLSGAFCPVDLYTTDEEVGLQPDFSLGRSVVVAGHVNGIKILSRFRDNILVSLTNARDVTETPTS